MFEFGSNNDRYGIHENKFRNLIKKIYFQTKNYLN